MDSKIKKIKTLHSKKNRSSLVNTSSHSLLAETRAEDSTTQDESKQSSSKKKEEPGEVEEHPDEAEDDSGAQTDVLREADEFKRKIELLSNQSVHMLTQLPDLQLRALNLGQECYRRRLCILPHSGGVHFEALESGEANAGPVITWGGKTATPIGPLGEEPPLPVKKEEMPEVKPEPEDEKEAVTANGTDPTPVEEEKKSEDPPPAEPVEVKKEEEVVDVLPALWFNILPRIPCDDHSLVNPVERDTAEEDQGADDRPKKEESGVKEEVDKSEMVPIPEAMSRGWWRIIDPEQVKTFVESLHPRGVREKELSRMLLRFMDFAK